jgi:thiamine transport system permease protein
LLRKRITEALDAASSRRTMKYSVYLIAIVLFFALILLPPILGIAINSGSIQAVLNNAALKNRALSAITNSFTIALFVSAIDLIAGIPMAWLIARKKSRWLSILDTLSDIPFIVPTAVLGYSLTLFWNGPEGISQLFSGPLISKGWLLVILLHFTFSFPVVVRVIVGALLDYKREFENASRTLGAPPFTASRTVTFPIIKPSLIAAFILAFSRSVSETGATFVVAGAFENGPIFLQNMKDKYLGINNTIYYGTTVFASFILIAVSVSIFITIRVLGPRFKLPVKRIWPSFERKLSYSKAESSRNAVTIAIFLIIVLTPSLFVALPAFQAVFTNTFTQSLLRGGTHMRAHGFLRVAQVHTGGIWGDYWQGLLLSYSLAAIVTVINIIIGLPMAIAIARRKLGPLSPFFDILVNIPLVVPSIALGFSLGFFWTQTFTSMPELLLLIFAHLAITYPYFVRSMSAAVERIPMDMEEASRTLGAKPLGVFRTIILPLTKYSMLSGAILVFTRSISETGATLAVATTLKTVPVVLVNWIKPPLGQPHPTPLQIGLGSGFLILFSFIILLALRLTVKGKGRY